MTLKGYQDAGYKVNDDTGQIIKTDSSADFIIASGLPQLFPEDVSLIIPFKKWFDHRENERAVSIVLTRDIQ